MVTAAAVQCGQTDGCATAFCASWAASARAEDRTAARRPMAAAAEPRDTVFAAGRCHAGHRPLAAAAAVCYAPGRLIEKDAGPECILGHAGAVVHGRLGVQRWEQPGRRMSPLREEPSRAPAPVPRTPRADAGGRGHATTRRLETCAAVPLCRVRRARTTRRRAWAAAGDNEMRQGTLGIWSCRRNLAASRASRTSPVTD
ncbi:uncharacterized protein LOC125537501 isoform X1 [Triticum urartu]|uniref:uncharacterized protein LOC125537501 isoform X1 n=1 Tax=Triticum urartu TaxID=4572 RepID=UPI002042D526|nr:uncharacterized protein LOC125537501 isoform X1 [Triticum urartu]XP_048556769.1 uncharacterized protein LOC125537501 isoform X1 [Triticum urartu]